jgi:hypothetical protein
MYKFLNTAGLREWIPRMIAEAKKEMVIIVPFIKTSENVYQSLVDADNRGVETLVVYREESLKKSEKEKLMAIPNLNLLHHPNVHAKCYMNETHLLITSINLYEHSELKNREMGILIEKMFCTHTGENIVDDAITEIRSIINSSTLEKESRETVEEGFEIDIIKDRRGRAEDFCRKLSKEFGHKHFEVLEYPGGAFSHICKNYYDHIDVVYEHRAEIILNFPIEKIKAMHYKFPRGEYDHDGFKFYWNHYKGNLYLYSNSKHPMWNDISDKEEIVLMKNGIDMIIGKIKGFI